MNSNAVKRILSYTTPFWIMKRKLQKVIQPDGKIIPFIIHDVPKSWRKPFSEFLSYAKSIAPFVTPLEFEAIMKGEREFRGTAFLLTFDDGFHSNREVADTILKELDIKATFFVCSNFIGLGDKEAGDFIAQNIFAGSRERKSVAPDEKAMNWDDLSSLLDQGHCIGAHTANHWKLSELSPEAYEEEIIQSGDSLEKKLGITIDWFAFPFGDIGSINQPALQSVASRYKYCFSGIRGTNTKKTHPIALRRDSIHLGDPLQMNQLISNGGLSPFYRKARRLLDSYVNEM